MYCTSKKQPLSSSTSGLDEAGCRRRSEVSSATSHQPPFLSHASLSVGSSVNRLTRSSEQKPLRPLLASFLEHTSIACAPGFSARFCTVKRYYTIISTATMPLRSLANADFASASSTSKTMHESGGAWQSRMFHTRSEQTQAMHLLALDLHSERTPGPPLLPVIATAENRRESSSHANNLSLLGPRRTFRYVRRSTLLSGQVSNFCLPGAQRTIA